MASTGRAPTSRADEGALRLIKPDLEHLQGFVGALKRGWSPDNIGGAATARRILAAIDADPVAYLATADDPRAEAGDITLPDGTKARRLPGFQRWMWDGEFCGQIGLRWAPEGGGELPAHVLGHIGYAVTAWKRGRGYATQALALLLPEARAVGLPWLILTTEPDNIPSQKVIRANGGRLLGRFRKLDAYGGGEALRWRIDL